MIMDKNLMFSEAQAITSSAASTNYLDQGGYQGDAYVSLFLKVLINEAFAAAGAATLNIQLQTAQNNDAAFAAPTLLFETGAIALAQLTLYASPLTTRLPKGVGKYLRLYYTVANGPFTAGKLTSFLVSDVDIKVPLMKVPTNT